MTSPDDHFLLATVDLDNITVGRADNGDIVVSRPLHDEAPTTMADVYELAAEHGLGAIDSRHDPDAGTLTVVFDGGDA